MEKVPFSLDWFLTVPGILISVGVILLIISIILFIISSMKEKKESIPSILEENKDENKEETVSEDTVQEKVELIDAVSEEVVVPSFEGDEVNAIDEVIPMDETIGDEIIFATDDIQTNDETPRHVEETVTEQNPIIEEVKVEELPVEENVQVIEETQPSIYGGADPLEATQNLPKVDVHHEPYSGGSIEAIVVDEVAEEPIVISEEPVIIEESKEVEVPEVIAIPDDDIENL